MIIEVAGHLEELRGWLGCDFQANGPWLSRYSHATEAIHIERLPIAFDLERHRVEYGFTIGVDAGQKQEVHAYG
jgi:hypothetical protein